jgi:hypothetical protein
MFVPSAFLTIAFRLRFFSSLLLPTGRQGQRQLARPANGPIQPVFPGADDGA